MDRWLQLVRLQMKMLLLAKAKGQGGGGGVHLIGPPVVNGGIGVRGVNYLGLVDLVDRAHQANNDGLIEFKNWLHIFLLWQLE